MGDLEAVAATLFGEVRSEPIAGMVAVANVIRNRVVSTRWPDTFKGVCLQPKQFSCWIPAGGAANHIRTLQAAEFMVTGQPLSDSMLKCLHIAEGLIAGLYRDNTNAADHYLTAALFRSAKAPKWAKQGTVVAEIGAHIFLKA